MNKVVKFGGSSLADATQFKKVANIINSDKSRRFVVPSAPGKRLKKIQKLLIFYIKHTMLKIKIHLKRHLI